MLDGLRALDLNQDTESVLGELIATSRAAIPFQDAFILIRGDGGRLRPIVTTAPLYDNSLWEPKAIFDRVLHGQPIALSDIEQAEEWRAQPPSLRNRGRSALLIPLNPAAQGESHTALLIYIHGEHGFFNQQHITAVQRFSLLASQALFNDDLKKALRARERFFTLSLDMMGIIHFGGYFKQLNPVWENILGYSLDEIKTRHLIEIVYPEDRPFTLSKLGDITLLGSEKVYFENRCLCKDGSYKWISWAVTAFLDEQLYYAVARDITERKQAEERLQHVAFHDTLTGLPNRLLFIDRLQQTITRAKRHKDYIFAVLFLDLDRFKIINDSLGHPAGDEVLIATSLRIINCLRTSDSAARLGGDEFCILLEDIHDIAGAVTVAERIQHSLSLPFTVKVQEIFTTTSIGIALSSTGYDHPEDMLRDADTAMYRAKAAGKARHEIFDAAMHTRAVTLLHLGNDLRHAIEHEEFLVYYQPIVALDSGQLVGFEALVRWQHPQRGLVFPGDFISLAEERGLIGAIGRGVLREACRQVQEWRVRYPELPPLFVSVNLSGKQFTEPDLLEQIQRALEDTGLPSSYLKLEITESVVMGNAAHAIEILTRLRAMGVRLSIDDFGTGYSSLSYLHRFPLDTLKIDRSFVNNITEITESQEIVKIIMLLAHNLGMSVIAEGIETSVQLTQLRALGCEYGQGYYFAKPLEARLIEPMLVNPVFRQDAATA
jgi:diguanylate cyclase (GGDEF)-like protein/PAS domain S-box-containing protein